MKENLTNEQATVVEKNPIQEKISFLCENDFLWKEIAVLTDLPKKLLKGIAKGTYIPNVEETNRLVKIFDNTISRLRLNIETNKDEPAPETNLITEGYECHTIALK